MDWYFYSWFIGGKGTVQVGQDICRGHPLLMVEHRVILYFTKIDDAVADAYTLKKAHNPYIP